MTCHTFCVEGLLVRTTDSTSNSQRRTGAIRLAGDSEEGLEELHVLPADVAPPPIRLAHQARSLPRSLPFLRLSESLRLLFLPSRTPQLTQT